MSDQPHTGIDFGTTTSAVSWWNPKTNAPEIIRNEHGDEKTPSVVYRGEEEILIGKPAWEQLHDVGQMDSGMQAAVLGRTFLSVKRLLKANLPLALPDRNIVTPVELAADILAHLKSTAERGCFGGKKVEQVSLSHPVIFNKTEKERLKEAASLAGFKECKLVEEPLAAIHGYLASGAQAGNNILVFDMGGGTLDLAFLCKDGDEYHMPIPPMGEEAGGDEFDLVLYDHFERRLEQKHGIRFSENGTCNLGVLAQCRKLKEKLTSVKQGRFTHFDGDNNIHVSFDLVRDELEYLIREQVDRAVKMAKAILEKIETGSFRLDTVLLVGGSTRIPIVREKLAEILPIKPLETMHADVAVAMGVSYGSISVKNAEPGTEAERFEIQSTPVEQTSWIARNENLVNSSQAGEQKKQDKTSKTHTMFWYLYLLFVVLGLAGVITRNIMIHQVESRVQTAKLQISMLEQALDSYYLDHGRYPTQAQGLEALIARPIVGPVPDRFPDGGYLARARVPLDAWGNPYIYLAPGRRGEPFEIISYGSDGKLGGIGHAADISSSDL